MGQKPSREYSLERIDNNKGYEPENCKWATPEDQNNNKRGIITVLHDGKIVSLKKYCRLRGLSYPKYITRIYRKGCTVKEALDGV
jgi:hypothetical protein